MASSGTVSLAIEVRYKPKYEGREFCLISGRAQIKNEAVIEAGDFTLRTIKQFIVSPYARPTIGADAAVIYGSITTAGSLMNSIQLNTLKGSHNPITGGVGTAHVGTVKAGTMQFSFMCVGA